MSENKYDNISEVHCWNDKLRCGLRSMSGDDGYGKPVESCLALHEMDLKPYWNHSLYAIVHDNLRRTATIAEKRYLALA